MLEGAPIGGGWQRDYLADMSDAGLEAIASKADIPKAAVDEFIAAHEWRVFPDGHTYIRERRQSGSTSETA